MDEFEQYSARNFLKKKPKEDLSEYSQYSADNFLKKDKKERSFASKLLPNIATGLLNAGRGIANTPHNIAGLVGLGEYVPQVDPEFNYARQLGLEDEQTTADKVIQGIAQYAPSLAIPGTSIKALAAGQAAYGATQNKNPLKGAAEGAIGGAAGGILGKGAQYALNKVRPSRLLRGNLTPEQLQKNIDITKGTSTGLGQVLGSPVLNRLHENILPNIIGSGSEKIAQKNAEIIGKKGSELFNKIKGDINPEDYGIHLQEALKTAEKEARAGKNANYAQLNKLAEENNVKVGRKNFTETASKVISDINKSPELKNEFGKELYKSLLKYAKNKEGNSLELTNIFRGKLGDKASKLYKDNNMHEYGLVKDLQNSLSKDIEESFNATGNSKLKEAYEKSQREYRENFAPFEDRNIVKFTRQGGDPDMILSHFLKGGKNDRATLLKKLDQAYKQNKTSPTKTNILPSAYLSKAFDAEGRINPTKFKTLYNNLGEKQADVLFGKGTKLHKEVRDYVNLVGKNAHSFNLMANPNTGQKLMGLLHTGLALKSLPLAIGGGVASNVASKLLTNESIREKLLKAMIKNKDFKIPYAEKAGAGISQSMYQNNKPMEIDMTGGHRE